MLQLLNLTLLVVVSYLVSRFSYQAVAGAGFPIQYADCGTVVALMGVVGVATADVCTIPDSLADIPANGNDPGPPDGWFMYVCCGMCMGGDMDGTTGGDSGGISGGFNPVTDCPEIKDAEECDDETGNRCLFEDGACSPLGGDMDGTTGGDSGGISGGFNPVTDCPEIKDAEECDDETGNRCLFEDGACSPL